MDDIYKNIEEYNPNKNRKIFVSDDMIADILSKKLNPIVTEFIRRSKLNISLAFITQSYFAVPKSIRINSMQWRLQQTAFNHSSDINFKDFINLYKMCNAKPYSFLIIDATLASDNPLRFRLNLSERIWKLIMTTDDKIRHEKSQYDVNREASKVSALAFGKIVKYENYRWRNIAF